MDTNNTTYFKKLANQLMFDLSDEEAENIKTEFDTLIQQLDLLDDIDTEHVEPMIYPFETPTSFLREDVVDNVISRDLALQNAKKVKDGMIVVPKVLK